MQGKFGLGRHKFFKYLQVRSFLNRQGLGNTYPIVKIPLVEKMKRKTPIGQLYQQLFEIFPDDHNGKEKKWENKLGIEDINIEESIDLANRVLILGRTRSQHYMALYELYYTPSNIAKWGATVGGKCNRCGLAAADSVHMFFSCFELSVFFREIETFLGLITGSPVIVTGELILIGVGTDMAAKARPRAISSFLFICMAVARTCFTNVWISPDPPTFLNWRTRLLAMFNLEMSIYKTKGRKKRAMGEKIWSPILDWIKA